MRQQTQHALAHALQQAADLIRVWPRGGSRFHSGAIRPSRARLFLAYFDAIDHNRQ
jgi:hypothetical protein